MKKLLSGVAFLVFLALIVLYATGAFESGKVGPGTASPPAGEPAPAQTVPSERIDVDLFEDAVGTVESRMRVGVAAQVTARVLTVTAEAGEPVTVGHVLVTLDDRELAARLAQAREALSGAEAARDQALQAKARGEARRDRARSAYDRIRRLFEGGAATPDDLEVADAERLQGEAGVADAEAAIAASTAGIQQAKQVVTEAEVALGHARIVAPIDGVVAERDVEPGDLAWPGRTLLTVLDPRALRLEAQVREGLISRVRQEARLRVHIPAADALVEGTVSEVIPSADPLTRTFRVRVDIEPVPGVMPGMFGRLRLPVGQRNVVRVPARAVVRVGQLETVLLRVGERWERRLVTTGMPLGAGAVEVLSGLDGGETLGLPEAR